MFLRNTKRSHRETSDGDTGNAVLDASALKWRSIQRQPGMRVCLLVKIPE
jgi:hypothetical protein